MLNLPSPISPIYFELSQAGLNFQSVESVVLKFVQRYTLIPSQPGMQPR